MLPSAELLGKAWLLQPAAALAGAAVLRWAPIPGSCPGSGFVWAGGCTVGPSECAAHDPTNRARRRGVAGSWAALRAAPLLLQRLAPADPWSGRTLSTAEAPAGATMGPTTSSQKPGPCPCPRRPAGCSHDPTPCRVPATRHKWGRHVRLLRARFYLSKAARQRAQKHTHMDVRLLTHTHVHMQAPMHATSCYVYPMKSLTDKLTP